MKSSMITQNKNLNPYDVITILSTGCKFGECTLRVYFGQIGKNLIYMINLSKLLTIKTEKPKNL